MCPRTTPPPPTSSLPAALCRPPHGGSPRWRSLSRGPRPAHFHLAQSPVATAPTSQADCGTFNEIKPEVTPIQIDIEYNFNHPPGSVPATDLLLKAAWNLCPQEGAAINGPPIPHGATCYYDQDNTFQTIQGSLSITVPDVPDGLWQVEVKNDWFNKISGAVRNQGNISREATLRKQSIAEIGALAGWATEKAVLSGALPPQPAAPLVPARCASAVCLPSHRSPAPRAGAPPPQT